MIKGAVDPSVDVVVTTFGLPRGGNKAWADFLDSNVSHHHPSTFSPDTSWAAQVGVTFVTNQNDPVPTVPPLLLGFTHSSGEIHIVDATQQNLVACPGQDNEHCATGNSLFHISIANHLGEWRPCFLKWLIIDCSRGPYFDDITFGGAECSS
jgi:hypothetical protein